MLDLSVAIADHLRECFYINGRWVRSHSTRRAALVSPVTERELLFLPLADATDVDRAVAAARTAFDTGPWPRMSGAERSTYLVRLADEIRKRLPLLAQLWTAQVGAPIIFANHLIHAGESRYDYFAELAASYNFEDRRTTLRGHARVRREPVGVAALIPHGMPPSTSSPTRSRRFWRQAARRCSNLHQRARSTRW